MIIHVDVRPCNTVQYFVFAGMHRPAPPTQASSRQVQGRGQGGGGGGGQSGGVLKLNVAIAGEFSMGNFGNQQ